MRAIFLYLTVIAVVLASVSLSVVLFRRLRMNEVARKRCLFLAAAVLTVTAELFFAFDANFSGVRVDGTYMLFHYSVLLPFLGTTLAFLIRYYRSLGPGTPKVRCERTWLVVPGVAFLAAVLNFFLPYRFRITAVGFSWYAVSYSLVVLLLLRSVRWNLATGEPDETAARISAGVLALTLGADLFFPWNRSIRDFFGFNFFPSSVILAVLSVSQLKRLPGTASDSPGTPGVTAASAGSTEPPSLDGFGLSPREKEVALYVREGRTNREIGELMFISLPTVKKHMANLFEKTGTRNRVELVRRIF